MRALWLLLCSWQSGVSVWPDLIWCIVMSNLMWSIRIYWNTSSNSCLSVFSHPVPWAVEETQSQTCFSVEGLWLVWRGGTAFCLNAQIINYRQICIWLCSYCTVLCCNGIPTIQWHAGTKNNLKLHECSFFMVSNWAQWDICSYLMALCGIGPLSLPGWKLKGAKIRVSQSVSPFKALLKTYFYM